MRTLDQVLGEIIAITRHVRADTSKLSWAKAEQLRRLITLAEYIARPHIGWGIEINGKIEPRIEPRSYHHQNHHQIEPRIGTANDKASDRLIPRFDDATDGKLNESRCSHEGCDKTWRSLDACLLNFSPAGLEPKWLCRDHHPPLTVEEISTDGDGNEIVVTHTKVLPVGFTKRAEAKSVEGKVK